MIREVQQDDKGFTAYAARTTVEVKTAHGSFVGAWEKVYHLHEVPPPSADMRIYEIDGRTKITRKDNGISGMYYGRFFMVIDVNAYDLKEY